MQRLRLIVQGSNHLIHLQSLGSRMHIVSSRRILCANRAIDSAMVKRRAIGKADAVYLPAIKEMVGNSDLIFTVFTTQDEIATFAADVNIAAVYVAEINAVMPSQSGVVIIDDITTESACKTVNIISGTTAENIIATVANK